jgi:hypothetical protein
MTSYLSNETLQARGYEVARPGFEITENFATGVIAVAFWEGFFKQNQILDRTYGGPALRRTVAHITPGVVFTIRWNPSTDSAIRYLTERTEADALAKVEQLIARRFAHVTAKEVR